jgi:hypothetical protein
VVLIPESYAKSSVWACAWTSSRGCFRWLSTIDPTGCHP